MFRTGRQELGFSPSSVFWKPTRTPEAVLVLNHSSIVGKAAVFSVSEGSSTTESVPSKVTEVSVVPAIAESAPSTVSRCTASFIPVRETASLAATEPSLSPRRQ